MAESETIKSVFTQVAIHTAAAAVIVLQEADTEPVPGANTANMGHSDR